MQLPRIRWVLGAAILASVFCGCKRSDSDSSGGADKLNGSGSTFVRPMMELWAKSYFKEKHVEVTYAPKGSGAGIKEMTEQTVDFGCTDAPMTSDELARAKEKNGDVIHVPLVMGGVVPAYNLGEDFNKKVGDKRVKFTGALLARIYLNKPAANGGLEFWDHEDIKAVQDKEVADALPHLKIDPVHRAEGSGTNYIFTDFLGKVSEEFNKEVLGGKGVGQKEVKWNGGAEQSGNPGIAGYVARTQGAVGYIELDYALKNEIKYGAVQNQEKEFVLASLESITAAAEAGVGSVKEDLTFNLTNEPGKKSYPICGAVWAVMYTRQPTDKGKALYNYFVWATNQGQDQAAEVKYARLPPALQEKIKKKLEALPH